MTLSKLAKNINYLVVLIAVFGLANTALAGVAPIPGGECTGWGIRCTGADTPGTVISYLWLGINVVLSFLATVAAAALVYYGILYIISRGEEEKSRQAKTGIVFALLGMIIVGLAAWIVNAVINL